MRLIILFISCFFFTACSKEYVCYTEIITSDPSIDNNIQEIGTFFGPVAKREAERECPEVTKNDTTINGYPITYHTYHSKK